MKPIDFVIEDAHGPVQNAVVTYYGTGQFTNNDGWTRFNVPDNLVREAMNVQAPGLNDSFVLTLLEPGASYIAGTTPGPFYVKLKATKPPDPIHVDPGSLTDEELRNFRGDFGGITVTEIIPANNPSYDIHPGNAIGLAAGKFFSFAYPIYNEADRKVIRKAYKDRNYTHIPLTLKPYANRWYRDIFPPCKVTNEILQEIYDDGLIPVCFITWDCDSPNDYKSLVSHIDPKFVRIVVPQGECNECGCGEVLSAQFREARKLYPKALLYAHFTPEHASGSCPDDSESDWWHQMVDEVNITGILYQDQLWNRGVEAVRDRITDFLTRMGAGYHGWPAPLDVVDFEEMVYPAFWNNTSEQEIIAMNNAVHKGLDPYCMIESNVQYCGWLKGFCSGGS